MLGSLAAPTCIAVWEGKFGSGINWRRIGQRYRQRLLTPKDFMTHYKLIIHRGLLTRHINQNASTSICRLCNRDIERIDHLACCPRLTPLWDPIILLCTQCDADPSPRPSKKITPTNQLTDLQRKRIILLGETECVYNIMPQAVGDFFLILWKFVLIHFTAVDLDRKKFDEEAVFTGATRRYISKVNVLPTRVLNKMKVAESRGTEANIKPENDILYPLGRIDTDGIIQWDYWFQRLLDCQG